MTTRVGRAMQFESSRGGLSTSNRKKIDVSSKILSSGCPIFVSSLPKSNGKNEVRLEGGRPGREREHRLTCHRWNEFPALSITVSPGKVLINVSEAVRRRV